MARDSWSIPSLIASNLSCLPENIFLNSLFTIFNQKILTTQTEIRKKVLLVLIRGDLIRYFNKKYNSETPRKQSLGFRILQLQKQLLVASQEHNWKATPIKDLKLNILRGLTEVAGLQKGRADPKPSENMISDSRQLLPKTSDQGRCQILILSSCL